MNSETWVILIEHKKSTSHNLQAIDVQKNKFLETQFFEKTGFLFRDRALFIWKTIQGLFIKKDL